MSLDRLWPWEAQDTHGSLTKNHPSWSSDYPIFCWKGIVFSISMIDYFNCNSLALSWQNLTISSVCFYLWIHWPPTTLCSFHRCCLVFCLYNHRLLSLWLYLTIPWNETGTVSYQYLSNFMYAIAKQSGTNFRWRSSSSPISHHTLFE